jgi:hypothetical protein
MILLPLKVCLLKYQQNEVTDISICVVRITYRYNTSIKHTYIHNLHLRYADNITQHELVQNYK